MTMRRWRISVLAGSTWERCLITCLKGKWCFVIKVQNRMFKSNGIMPTFRRWYCESLLEHNDFSKWPGILQCNHIFPKMHKQACINSALHKYTFVTWHRELNVWTVKGFSVQYSIQSAYQILHLLSKVFWACQSLALFHFRYKVSTLI